MSSEKSAEESKKSAATRPTPTPPAKSAVGVAALLDPPTASSIVEREDEDSDFEKVEAEDDWSVPKDWTGSAFDANFVIERFDKRMSEIAKAKLNMLYGTSYPMVVASFLKGLFISRKKQNPKQLLTDMVFSVFVSQTVSREWAKVYSQFPATTIFKPFEIDSQRTADPNEPKSNWVTNSKMNATAVGMLGHLIMESVPPNTALGRKAKEDGTHFNPRDMKDFPNSEYVKLCNEAKNGLTTADKEALEIFRKQAGHLAEVVAMILESDASSLNVVLAALSKLVMKNF